MTSVGYSAFSSCNILTTIDLPNATSIGRYAFNQCWALTSVDCPNVTSIGEYGFHNNKSMVSANIPKVTILEDSTFAACASLTSINIQSVTDIKGFGPFDKCTNLRSIRLSGTPPKFQFNRDYFASISSECTFYIPTGSLATYRSDKTWSSIVSKYSFVEEDR